MSPVITEEFHFLLVSVLWGGLMAAGYEILRLLRLLVRHGYWWIGLEDLLYWTFCAIMVFAMVMEENDGTVRWYVLAGGTAGAYLYQVVLHRILVWILSPVWKIVQLFYRFLKKLLKKSKKSVTLKGTMGVHPHNAERGRQHGQIRQKKEAQTESSGDVRHHPGSADHGGCVGISDRTGSPEKRSVR